MDGKEVWVHSLLVTASTICICLPQLFRITTTSLRDCGSPSSLLAVGAFAPRVRQAAASGDVSGQGAIKRFISALRRANLDYIVRDLLIGRTVNARWAFGFDFAFADTGDFKVAAGAEAFYYNIGSEPAYPLSQIFSCDDEIMAESVLAANDNMGMGMAGASVIGGDPVQFGSQVLFHLRPLPAAAHDTKPVPADRE